MLARRTRAPCYPRAPLSRRDLILLSLIAALALGVRTYPAWDSVFSPAGVSFLETDAWYHVRLIEHQVHNYPWRATLDPYASPDGQFVPIAPLFDTLSATAVVLLHGRRAETAQVERVAAFVPPILGTLTVIVVWALGRRMFDRRAGALGAALLAILPGHFLDRTMLGFVDHHALEALLAMSLLLAISIALDPSPGASPQGIQWWRGGANVARGATGVVLGLYLLAWSSGAFLLAILGVWLVICVAMTRRHEAAMPPAMVVLPAALIALLLVWLFQDARMHRYPSQVAGLAALACIAALTLAATHRRAAIGTRPWLLATTAVIIAVAAALALRQSDVVTQVVVDVWRLAPDASRMGVLEARPLFLYSGEWRWQQPWTFFRSGFFIGLAALLPFAVKVWRERRPIDLLVWLFALAVLAATIGQNRFGYYLVPACALLGGWLAVQLLDWSGVPHTDNPMPTPRTRIPFARELAVAVVAGAMFAPNLAPQVLLAERGNSFPIYWRDTMAWLRMNTPPPFAQSAGRGDEFYLARYPSDGAPLAGYSVMNWWDQGYWITQQARRVPVANPTQSRAPDAARFYAETDEKRALSLLRSERARYAISDWELPFRKLEDGTIMGRFQNIVDWAGGTHARFYEIVYRRVRDAWTPVWIFHQPYYESMAFRLSVLGGVAADPSEASTVMRLVTRVDPAGTTFREIVSQSSHRSYESALRATASAGGDTMIVGLDPWRAAFPIPALTRLQEVHAARTPEQRPTETPWVRVFEVR